MRILVVEDEAGIRQPLVQRLEEAGFVVDQAADGEEGLYYAREFHPDLAIIDLGLPGMGGMELIHQARQQEATFPILVLTARDRWQDKVEALEKGADDYLVKPFHMEELLARVNALLRRSAGHATPVVENGPIAMDTRAQTVQVQGRDITLTTYEYRVLEYLMLHVGKVVSKTELTEHVYAEDADRDSNTLEVFVGRLRKKLDPEGSLQPIETLRGRGYRFREL